MQIEGSGQVCLVGKIM